MSQNPYGWQHPQQYAQPYYAPPPKRSNAKVWWIVIGSVVAGVFLCCGGGVALMFFFNQTPSDIAIRAEAPLTVPAGEQFTFKIIVDNLGNSSQSLHSIDFTNNYIQNVAITLTDPPWVQSYNVPLVDMQSFVYQRHIPAGQSIEIIFHARALQPGDHIGGYDVAINNEYTYMSDTIRTVVVPAEENDG